LLPVCLTTIGFFGVYRLVEDYLLVPRIIGRAVKVPALVTVVAVLVGGAPSRATFRGPAGWSDDEQSGDQTHAGLAPSSVSLISRLRLR
jgi:hypothetical protein